MMVTCHDEGGQGRGDIDQDRDREEDQASQGERGPDHSTSGWKQEI